MVDATRKYGPSAGVTHLGEVPAARHHVKPELGHEGTSHCVIEQCPDMVVHTRHFSNYLRWCMTGRAQISKAHK